MDAVIEREPHNRRTVAMWAECGLHFRANIVEPGGRIALHRHDYDHVAICTAGWFDCEVVKPDGTAERFQVAGKDFATNDPSFAPRGYRVSIPAWHQHTFILREAKDVGEILCLWPET